MYFYRDKAKHEVDLLMDEGATVKAYEIKSATVFHTDFFSDLNYFRKLLGDAVSLSQVVYDGQQEWLKPDNGCMNFRHLQ